MTSTNTYRSDLHAQNRRVRTGARRRPSSTRTRVLAVAVYTVTLHLIYVRWITPLFSYAGFGYSSPSSFEWVVSATVIGLGAVFMPAAIARPSQFVAWWLLLTLAVPVTLVPIYRPGDSDLSSWLFAAVATAAIAVLGRLSHLRHPRRFPVRVSERAYLALLLSFSAATILWAVAALPVEFKLVWLTDIAEQRGAFADASASMPGVFGYLFRWQSAAVSPALMAFGLSRRRHLVFIAGLAGQLLLYGLTGYKQIVVSIVLVPASYALLRSFRGGSRPDVWLTGTLVVGCWLSVLMDRVANTIDFTSVFVRRAILVAGIYTPHYIEYFGQHGFDNFSHSLLEGVTTSAYRLPPPLTIAREFYGANFSANANFLVDGYANLGYFGVLVTFGVVAVALYMVDTLTERNDLPLAGAMLVVPVTSLANSAAFATLTTHGLGMVLILIAICPRSPTDPGQSRPIGAVETTKATK